MSDQNPQSEQSTEECAEEVKLSPLEQDIFDTKWVFFASAGFFLLIQGVCILTAGKPAVAESEAFSMVADLGLLIVLVGMGVLAVRSFIKLIELLMQKYTSR